MRPSCHFLTKHSTRSRDRKSSCHLSPNLHPTPTVGQIHTACRHRAISEFYDNCSRAMFSSFAVPACGLRGQTCRMRKNDVKAPAPKHNQY